MKTYSADGIRQAQAARDKKERRVNVLRRQLKVGEAFCLVWQSQHTYVVLGELKNREGDVFLYYEHRDTGMLYTSHKSGKDAWRIEPLEEAEEALEVVEKLARNEALAEEIYDAIDWADGLVVYP